MANNVTLFVRQEIRCFLFAFLCYTYYLLVFFHAFDNIHKFIFKMVFIYFLYFDELVFVHFRFVSWFFSIDVLPLGVIRFVISIQHTWKKKPLTKCEFQNGNWIVFFFHFIHLPDYLTKSQIKWCLPRRNPITFIIILRFIVCFHEFVLKLTNEKQRQEMVRDFFEN